MIMDEDKTREQLLSELTQLRRQAAASEASHPHDGDRRGDPNIEDVLRAIHRSPAVTFVWRACDGWPVSFVSESVRRYGHTPQDLIGLARHERYVAAEDLPSFIQAFMEAGGAHHSRSFAREYRLLTRSGETRWVRERLWVERDGGGVVTHYTGLLTDVEELRKLEATVQEQRQRLSALFECASQPILLHDLGGRCIDANLAACDFLGYSRDELLQVPFDTLVSPATGARAQRLTRGAVGESDILLEGELVGRDGSGLPVILECRVIDLNGERAILCLSHQSRPCASLPAPQPQEAGVVASVDEFKALERRIEALEEQNRTLGAERDDLIAARSRCQEQLAQRELLVRDVHHRVKNNLQVIASLLGLQAEYVQDPRALDAFAESQNRVRAMALVHERIYQSGDLARVDLAAYVRDLAERLFAALGADANVALSVDVEPVSLPMDAAIPCGLLISELVSNSLKHAFPNGRGGLVNVSLHQDDDRIVLTVADDGVGLPEGLDYRKTDSLGLQLVTILAQQLDATVDVNTSAGTRFTFAFQDGG